MADEVRLQKFLARAGVGASRRAAEEIITAGRVTVNGKTVTKLGTKVDPDFDIVTLDGETIAMDAPRVTLAFNKPAGVMTTMSDPQGRPCVADYAPLDRYPGLFPIGRLDRDTTGLLLFTTDGELGNNLLHPRYHVDKTYLATVVDTPDKHDLDELRKGVLIDEGSRSFLTSPATVKMVDTSGSQSVLRITIHEGRNRQVRKMCETVGHPVIALERISFGPVLLGDLEPGAWRELTSEELSALNAAAGTAQMPATSRG